MEKKSNEILMNFGKIIAILSAILGIIHIIPMNGILQWAMLLSGIIFIILGKIIK